MRHAPFTRTGVRFFTKTALNDIFNALDNGNEPPNIVITVGRRSIEIPTHAEIWENLETFLNENLEVFEDVEN